MDEKSIPLFQDFAWNYSLGCNDVCQRPPLSLCQVEDLLHERGIKISYETVRTWWNHFGPMNAVERRKKRPASLRASPQWRWHLEALDK